MRHDDFKKKSAKELQELVLKKREELRVLRFQTANNQLKGVRQIRHARKEIARMLTTLRQQERLRMEKEQ